MHILVIVYILILIATLIGFMLLSVGLLKGNSTLYILGTIFIALALVALLIMENNLFNL